MKSSKNLKSRTVLLTTGLVLAVTVGVIAKNQIEKAKQGKVAAEQKQEQAAKKKKKKKAVKNQDIVHSEEELRHIVSEMTGGKRARIVWVESHAKKEADPIARGKELRLVGFDSKEDGYEIISEELANYAKPLITPDGEKVLYTDKGAVYTTEVPDFHPQVHLIDWDGENDHILTPGFCVDVAIDPKTNVTWVYALEKLNPSNKAALSGENLFRFQLNDPTKREPLWNKSELTIDNLQFSRDGKRFTSQFPWPEGAWADLASGTIHKLTSGCWTSFAPDDSYMAWIFAGSHKKLRMFDTVGGKSWDVALNKAPGIKNSQAYHPRWSNHPLFFAMTGPYPTNITKTPQVNGQPVKAGPFHAEIYLGKFSPKLDAVESWARLTTNIEGDFYPDAWIEGGDAVVLEKFKQGAPMPKMDPPPAWPPALDNLLYYWANSESTNQIAGRHMSCRAIGRGIARFGRQNDMILDGGWFETEPATNEALAKDLPAAKALSLEFLFTENSALPEGQTQTIVSLTDEGGSPYLEVLRSTKEIVFKSSAGKLGVDAIEIHLSVPYPGFTPQHVLFRLKDGQISSFVNGKHVVAEEKQVPINFALVKNAQLKFGQEGTVPAGWSGRLQNVALYGREFNDAEVATHEKVSFPKPLLPATVVKLRAKLTAATTPDLTQLASYTRMLVDHTYEVSEVIEGKFEAKQVNVLHWSVLDRTKVPGFPREVGKEYELILEPADQHPEIASELQQSESDDFDSAVYFDIGTPPLLK